MSNQTVTLSVLLVEDSDYKITRINEVLSDFDNVRIEIVKDQISAQNCLEREKYDLMILDMQLPLRFGEGLPDPKGGEKLLSEIDNSDVYRQPGIIIALTQYEESESSLRLNFAEIATLKFEPSSKDWEGGIKRTLIRSIKGKKEVKNIIYCEGNNAKLFNLVGLKDVEFIGLSGGCRAVYLAAKNEPDKFALRDRDFLTRFEIDKLRKKYPNYFILEYYCFENYLYHPDNIAEVVEGFDVQAYKDEVTRQKNEKLLAIIEDYKISRNAYPDLTDDSKAMMDKEPGTDILAALQSDEFEKFYVYFDMAGKKDRDNTKSFDRTFLMKHNLDANILVKSSWFKTQISDLFGIKYE